MVEHPLITAQRTISRAAQQLWEALEVIAVTHQEHGSVLSEREKRDLASLVEKLIGVAIHELESTV